MEGTRHGSTKSKPVISSYQASKPSSSVQYGFTKKNPSYVTSHSGKEAYVNANHETTDARAASSILYVQERVRLERGD
ncbi:hypothetical protein SLA2020_056290 [Shorea laevis]